MGHPAKALALMGLRASGRLGPPWRRAPILSRSASGARLLLAGGQQTMSTVLNILAGIGSVTILFFAMLICKIAGTVSSTKTTGIGALFGDLSWALINPAFWLSAVAIFFGVVFLARKRQSLRHS